MKTMKTMMFSFILTFISVIVYSQVNPIAYWAFDYDVDTAQGSVYDQIGYSYG